MVGLRNHIRETELYPEGNREPKRNLEGERDRKRVGGRSRRGILGM